LRQLASSIFRAFPPINPAGFFEPAQHFCSRSPVDSYFLAQLFLVELEPVQSAYGAVLYGGKAVDGAFVMEQCNVDLVQAPDQKPRTLCKDTQTFLVRLFYNSDGRCFWHEKTISFWSKLM
jgi:hypothetical protein